MLSNETTSYISSLSDSDLMDYIQVGTPSYTQDAVAFAQYQFLRRNPSEAQKAQLAQAIAARQAGEASMEEYGPDYGLGRAPPPRVNAARMLKYFGWSYLFVVACMSLIVGPSGFFQDVAVWGPLFFGAFIMAIADLVCARNIRRGGRVSVAIALGLGTVQTLLFVPILILLLLAALGITGNGYTGGALPLFAFLTFTGVCFGFSLCHSLLKIIRRDNQASLKGFPLD